MTDPPASFANPTPPPGTTEAPAPLGDHVVICNCNEKVRQLVAELREHDPQLEIVVLVQDPQLWQQNTGWHPRDGTAGVTVIHGCPTEAEALCAAQIATARAAVILADPRFGELADPRSTLVAIAIEQQNPQVHTVMELISSVSRIHVRSCEVNEIVCLGDISEKLLAQSCITPGVGHIFDHLLSGAANTEQLLVLPAPDSAQLPQTFRQLARRAISSKAPFVLCGFIQTSTEGGTGQSQPRITVLNPRAGVSPGKDTELTSTDALIVLSRAAPDLAAYLSESATHRDGEALPRQATSPPTSAAKTPATKEEG